MKYQPGPQPRTATRPWDAPPALLAAIVALAGLLGTAVASFRLHATAVARDRETFERSAQRQVDVVGSRLDSYIALLRSTAALLASDGTRTPLPAFRTYVQRLMLREKYPGVYGVGYTRRVAAHEVAQVEAEIRTQGLQDFKIWPAHPRDEYYPIFYLEPPDERNLAAMGFDMFTEPVRREAMERARDTAGPAVSGRVTLIQEIDPLKQPGFLIYVPVWANVLAPATVEERRAALRGYAYSPFRSWDLFASIAGEQSDGAATFEVYDGPTATPAARLFGGAPDGKRRPQFTSHRTISVAGRTWTIVSSSTPAFEAAHSDFWELTAVAAGGVLLTLVVSGLVGLEGRSRRNANRDRARLVELNEELRRNDERERRAREEAEAANRLKDEFLATLSHELRTPLTAVLGWTQLLRRDLSPPGGLGRGPGSSDQAAELAEGLAVIERNARVQARLIEDLLDMSRIMSGKLRIDVRPVDLVGVVRAAIESVRPSAEAKEVRVELEHDDVSRLVRGDGSRLQQVAWNLLTNAIKFSPAGGVVRVAIRRSADGVRLTVTDVGVGIAGQFLPHVFDRFRQADGSITRRHGGLGLGLAIVKSIVEAHGGAVHAESPGEGLGATFTAQFPVRAIAAEAPTRPVASRHAAGFDDTPAGADGVEYVDGQDGGPPPGRPLRGISVLVVDDDADALGLLRRVLGGAGATVHIAGSAPEALAALAERRPHVLVSDIGMPGADGYTLIRRVRELSPERGGRTPAAALTAFARSEDRRRALDAGYQAHLPKPVDPDELVTQIATLAEHGRAG